MRNEIAVCPHPQCRATITVPRHLVDGGTKLCLCPCHSIRVVPMRTDGGEVVLHRVMPVADKPLRKGDRVLVWHSYQGVHGSGAGEWYSETILSRGGRTLRDRAGAPLDLTRVVGVIEEVDG